jgi:hypothetical protein
MGLGIGERQGRPPRAAENEPIVDPEEIPQSFYIGDEIEGRVGLEIPSRLRTAAAALVEEDDAVAIGIEQPAMVGLAATARTAVEKQYRLALGVAAGFPIEAMSIPDVEVTAIIGLDRWIERDGFGSNRLRSYRFVSISDPSKTSATFPRCSSTLGSRHHGGIRPARRVNRMDRLKP